MGHLRLTIGYLKATVVHIRVTIGHLKVTISNFFSELHPKVRPTCFSYFDTLHYAENVDRYNADTVTEQVLPVGVGNRG